MSVALPAPGRSLPERLGRIVAGLRRDLAFHAARDRALAALVLLLWNRLSRVLARVTGETARAGTGHASPPLTRVPRVPATAPPRDPLPRQFGWLLRRVPDCAVHGEHLRLLLDDPEVQLLIVSNPHLRRLLRPLWRMLRSEPAPELLRDTPSRPTPSPPRHRRPPGWSIITLEPDAGRCFNPPSRRLSPRIA